MTFRIHESGDMKGLIATDDNGVDISVGIDLKNTCYLDFLDWNSKQQPPLVLPAGWPTLE